VLTAAVAAPAERPEALKWLDMKRDRARLVQRPAMAGYFFYLDRFNGIRGVLDRLD
jgi:hypothetical protein